jgi:Na+/melibiose symporter-like transporter
MGTGLKKARVTEEGLFATSDWSWYNQRMCLKDKNFWKLFVMLFSSVTYCFFVKVGNKVFGSLYHENDSFLTITSMEGYFFAACARFAAPILMQKIGFFKTYSLALIIEIVLATTFVYVAKEPHLFRIWVIVSLMCEGTHFSIFPPLSGQIYGPV